MTLDAEYCRDIEKGMEIKEPGNYYKGDDFHNPSIMQWRAHAYLLFAN